MLSISAKDRLQTTRNMMDTPPLPSLPLVSFIIVARNASCHLPGILSDLMAQDYPKERMEVLLVDGCSQDNSRKIMQEFAAAHLGLRVKVLDNPGKILASGWNVALAEAQGDIILRVDAHSKIPVDFITKSALSILDGKDIAGGVRISQRAGEGVWKSLLEIAERSKFGSGVADFRNPGPRCYVDTLAHAAYRREVFETVGGYDERLVRNQDMEIHRRMKMAGYRLFFNPEIISYHKLRSSLKDILWKNWNDGKWIGLALGISPRCFSLRHFIPALFTGALSISCILGILGILGAFSILGMGSIGILGIGSRASISAAWLPFFFLIAVYGLAAFAFTLSAIVKAPLRIKPLCALLPVIFLLLHLSYGFGTWFGLAKMPLFMRENGEYQLPWPLMSTSKRGVIAPR